jgi:purine-cytosine permease-like protein
MSALTEPQQGPAPPGHAEPSLHDEAVLRDYTETVVPEEARRSNWRMFLQFSSMQLVFGAVLVGYTARFQGLTLGQLALAMGIAVIAMTVYCIGSANVGAVFGQTMACTTRSVFGRVGSWIVSLLLVVDGMGFYLFTVIFIVSLGTALLGTLPAVTVLTAALALVMIVNSYFGFTGLLRFAQYVALPVIVLWGCYAMVKALTTVTSHQLAAVPHASSSASLFIVVGAMVGLSTWGNEADVFRYARSGRASLWNIPTVAVAYVVGAFLFPILGYLIATLSNQPDFSASMRYFADFTLFGLAAVMLLVLVINQWAVQDGNLYIAINGAQNLLSGVKGWHRQLTVVGLGLIAAGLTFIMPNLTKTFTIVTGIGAVTIPVASTIMAMDLFVVPRLFGIRRRVNRVPLWHETALANWPAIIALLTGTGLGAYTAGLIPGLSGFGKTNIGFPALQAWGTGAVVYLVLIAVAVAVKSDRVRDWLGHWQHEPGQELAEAPITQ